ncbi:hypothetical protein MWU59_00420 [Flavobacteriaceae bacterium F08102]|nr:hypothetical protein [Flavobacteriaceae bacterium F08102]
MLGYMSAANAKVFQNCFSAVQFLIGEYAVEVYSYSETEGWFHSGNGKSRVYKEDNVIFENLQVTKENVFIHFQNTMVVNSETNNYKLMSLDLVEGRIDTYLGSENKGVLTFLNGENTKGLDKPKYLFKLIYKELSSSTVSLIIGCSKDDGKTWLPFVKNLYNRIAS